MTPTTALHTKMAECVSEGEASRPPRPSHLRPPTRMPSLTKALEPENGQHAQSEWQRRAGLEVQPEETARDDTPRPIAGGALLPPEVMAHLQQELLRVNAENERYRMAASMATVHG